MDSLITRLVRAVAPAVLEQSFNQVRDLWAREMPAIAIIAPDILTGGSKSLVNLRTPILAPHLLWNADELSIRSR